MAPPRAGGRRGARRARPRYKRLTAAGGAAGVTLVATLGGLGLLPAAATGEVLPSHGAAQQANQAGLAVHTDLAGPRGGAPGLPATAPPPPTDSGTGRRVVFDISAQRVWLVDRSSHHDSVARTYLVSGGLTDNLKPGSYSVDSRSLHALGIDDSGTMRYFVQFAHGQHAAIGFHDIPVKDGVPVQSTADLGTPQSHGCIRQSRPDARALWHFAPVGTRVVVVA